MSTEGIHEVCEDAVLENNVLENSHLQLQAEELYAHIASSADFFEETSEKKSEGAGTNTADNLFFFRICSLLVSIDCTQFATEVGRFSTCVSRACPLPLSTSIRLLSDIL